MRLIIRDLEERIVLDAAFDEQVVVSTADGASDILAVDVDGDGDTDLVTASSNDNTIAWYENDGSESFTKRTVATDATGASSVFAADIDGDGDIDLISAAQTSGQIAWYENDGSLNFIKRIVSTSASGATSVFAADVDGDGDIDILSASYADDKLAWYENDGSQNFTERVVSTSANGATTVIAADVDGDGDIDLVSASFLDDKIAWYENQLARKNAFSSTPNLIASSDSGGSATDNITSDTTPTFTGTTEAGSSVSLTSSIDGALGSVTADQAGRWEITSLALSEGIHSITATATDGAASATSSALAVTIDTTVAAPSVTIDTTAPANTEGSSPDPVSLLDLFDAAPARASGETAVAEQLDPAPREGSLSLSLRDLLQGQLVGLSETGGFRSDLFAEQDATLPNIELESLLGRLRRRFWLLDSDVSPWRSESGTI